MEDGLDIGLVEFLRLKFICFFSRLLDKFQIIVIENAHDTSPFPRRNGADFSGPILPYPPALCNGGVGPGLKKAAGGGIISLRF